MTCPRCDGLLVREYLLNPHEGSLSGFQGSRCLNCDTIHDNVIRTNDARMEKPQTRCSPLLLLVSPIK